MRRLTLLCVFVVLGVGSTEAQVLPSSSGSCGVSASGVMGCNWISAIDLKRETPKKGSPSPDVSAHSDERPALVVTRYTLAPGAPLSALVEGRDFLIVGMNAGELTNEKKSPPIPIDVSTGSVMLMPKEESYLLRNIGKENLDLLVIDVTK
jgi:hypothetical protein